MHPGDEAQAPIGGILANDPIEPHGPFQERASKRGIMHVGRGEQEEERQAGAAAEQGMAR